MNAERAKGLNGKRIAYLIAPFFEDEEGTKPKEFLEKQGAKIVYLGLARTSYLSKHGQVKIDVDKTFDQVTADDFDAVVIPGGLAPKYLRSESTPIDFVKSSVQQNKVVAAICHGPQLLISAGVLKGRSATGHKDIRDEMVDAGAKYSDEPVVVDGNLITSRTVSDIPHFNQAILNALESKELD